MIEAVLLYLLLFGLVVETIIVFALIILVIILSKQTIKKHICNLAVQCVFLHINWQTTFVDSPFPIFIIFEIFEIVKYNVKFYMTNFKYFIQFYHFYKVLQCGAGSEN